MTSPDDICECGDTRDDHDAQGYCLALHSLVTCECTAFVLAVPA